MPRVVRIYGHGGPEVMRIDEVPHEPLQEGEVRLRIQAIGLNRSDILFRKGLYTPHRRRSQEAAEAQIVFPARIGAEATGVIEEIRGSVEGLQVGDHVVTIPTLSQAQHGVYGESAVVPAHLVMKYPDTLTAIEGAAASTSYLTAYGALVDYGQVRPGDNVLITSASSSVGIAAMQIVKAEKATVIATTRTTAKRQSLLDARADHVVVTDNEDLAQRVLEITGGEGARLIFDAVAGPQLEALSTCAATNGIIIEYGAFDRRQAPYPFLNVLWKNLTIRGWTIYNFVEDSEPGRLERAKTYIYEGLRSEALKPLVDRTFAFEQIADAHSYLEESNHVGKVVVTVSEEDKAK